MRYFWFICFLITLSGGAFASIGEITQAEGPSTITRDTGGEVEGTKGTGILSMDIIQTFKGTQHISFIDETELEVTSHSRVVIDEFVYDPANDLGTLSIKAGLGTVRYASGQIAKKYKQNVTIKTPTAVIGVRGTDFTMTVDETGSSMIILLPSCDGDGDCFVGEISVDSAAGQVILNQAFQVTVVETIQSPPLNPILLSIDENMINNLLIVQKPKVLETELEKTKILKQVANALEIDFLEFNDLDVDALDKSKEELAQQSELDLDFLIQDFLQDILEVINKQLALQMRSEFQKKKTGTIQEGKNAETGVTFLSGGSTYVVIKEDTTNYIELRLSKDHNYNMTLKQNYIGVEDLRIGDGVNDINISQSN